MELNPAQIAVITLVAIIVTQLYKLYEARKGNKPSRQVVTLALFLVAMTLSVVWALPQIEPSDDPMQLAANVSTALLAALGTATVIYNTLGKDVFKRLGMDPDVLLEKPDEPPALGDEAEPEGVMDHAP